jgi:protein TonB
MDRSLFRSEGSLEAGESFADSEATRGRAPGMPPPARGLEPTRGATVVGVVFALGLHASVFALSPRYTALAASKPAAEVEVEIFVPEPPPKAEPEEPAPVVIAPVEKPRPARLRGEREAAPAPKAVEDTPPPAQPEPPKVVEAPAPAQPAPALVAAADAPSTGHDLVQSATGALGGSGTGGPGGPSATGTGLVGRRDGVVGGTGTGSAQPVTLSMKSWRCPWPDDAEYEDINEQLVAIKVVVAEDGKVEQAEVVSDPGFGFGAAARDCARRVRFTPARDAQGRAIRAQSPPIHVRFVR